MNAQRETHTHTHTATPDGESSPGWVWVFMTPSPTQRGWQSYIAASCKGRLNLLTTALPCGIWEVAPLSRGVEVVLTHPCFERQQEFISGLSPGVTPESR